MHSADDLLTTAEAAEMLGRSVSQVARYASADVGKPRLPVARKLAGPRGALLFARHDVEVLAAELSAEPQSAAG